MSVCVVLQVPGTGGAGASSCLSQQQYLLAGGTAAATHQLHAAAAAAGYQPPPAVGLTAAGLQLADVTSHAPAAVTLSLIHI